MFCKKKYHVKYIYNNIMKNLSLDKEFPVEHCDNGIVHSMIFYREFSSKA